MTRTVGLIVILGGTLLAEAAWTLRPPRPVPLAGPTIGEALPNVGAISVENGPPRGVQAGLIGDGRCGVVIVIDPTCSACRRMRREWPAAYRAWRDSVGGPVRLTWLSNGDSAETANFYRGFRLPGVTRARYVFTSATAMSRLGVYLTPTTYLLDRDGRLRVGDIENFLPPADSTRAVCGLGR